MTKHLLCGLTIAVLVSCGACESVCEGGLILSYNSLGGNDLLDSTIDDATACRGGDSVSRKIASSQDTWEGHAVQYDRAASGVTV